MTTEYFDPNRFRSSLREFIEEVWTNPNQAANESGIAYQDLYDTITGKKNKLLRSWQINALLNCAVYTKGLKQERYDYWYQILHRELIFIRTLSAWLYSETDKRIKDPILIDEAVEHNKILKDNLAKQFPFLETVVDTVFKAGGLTWSFATIYFILRKTKPTKDISEIFLPNDWQIYALDLTDVFVGFELPSWETIATEAPGKIKHLIDRGPVLLRNTLFGIIKRRLGG